MEEEIPQGWSKVVSRSTGKEYYVEKITGNTQWERPKLTKDGESRVPVGKVAGALSSGATRFGFNITSGISSMLSNANSKFQNTFSEGNMEKSRSMQFNEMYHDHEWHAVYENENLVEDLKMVKRYTRDGEGFDAFPGELEIEDDEEWTSEWIIDIAYTSVDSDGWTYGRSFKEMDTLLKEELSHASKHPSDVVRRRRWIRFRKKKNGKEEVVKERKLSNVDRLNEEDDPFSKSGKTTSTPGFRVPKFALRGEKDHTKEYQNLGNEKMEWLVKQRGSSNGPSKEALQLEMNVLEKRMLAAKKSAKMLEKKFGVKHEQYKERANAYEVELQNVVDKYKKLRASHRKIVDSIQELRLQVDKLKQETSVLDGEQNQELRNINDQVEASNSALEEKQKALTTASIRYDTDIAALREKAANMKHVRSVQETHKKNNPHMASLQNLFQQLVSTQTKLANCKNHRRTLDEERREMFNQLVEHKANHKLQSNSALEQKYNKVEQDILDLKQQQKLLIKDYTQNSDIAYRRQIDLKREIIRKQLAQLREHRMQLAKERKRQ